MSVLTKPIRFTSQKQQELISRHQFQERLVKFGWKPTVPEDLGEDVIVDIYFQGRAAGVNFYVQLKSITNLDERHKGDHLVYDDFKVKDLKHWETFEQPVVLVVWDVELRAGRWALVDTVIAELDRRRPQWRGNKTTASVRIPWNNTTDDAGLMQLRKSIGRHLYPLIARDKPAEEIKIELSFPGTQEGQDAWRAFDRWIKEGEPVTIEGKFIKKFIPPQWETQWFGEPNLDEGELTIGPWTSQAIPTGVDFISADGKLILFEPIELKAVGIGTEKIQFSNEHQTSPLHFHFVIPRSDKYKESTMSFKVNNWGRHAYIARDILGFLRAVVAGGKLRLTSLINDDARLEFKMPPQSSKLSVSIEEWEFIDKLCKIQDKTDQFIQVPIEPTSEDIWASNKFIAIIEHGHVITKPAQATWEPLRQDLNSILDVARQGKSVQIRMSFDESYGELFGSKIQTGRMVRYITGMIEMPAAELEQAIATLAPDKYLSIKLVDAEVIEIFPDWFIREAERLSQRLVEDLGVESVYLFGSLVWSNVHAPETDIDLAVSGLPSERYLEAVGYLERESTFPVDLVDLNNVPDQLRQRIFAEGKKLNERETVTALSG